MSWLLITMPDVSYLARRCRCYGFLLALLAGLMSGGCAYLPESLGGPREAPIAVSDERERALNAIESWGFRGRVAVQRAGEGWSATLDWAQRRQQYQVRIAAPLGQGTYELTKTPQEATVRDEQNQVYRAADPETLLFDTTGWRLPLAGIEYWVRGLTAPASNAAQIRRDEQGLLRDFAVDGWRVSVLDYVTAAELQMPRKLFMSFNDTKIRVVISSWRLEPEAVR